MNRDNAAAPAQDNTAPAAAAPATPAPAPAQAGTPAPATEPPAAPQAAPAQAQSEQGQAEQAKPVADGAAAPDEKEGKKDEASPAAGMEMLLGDDGDENGDGAPPAPAADGEGYELTFPDDTVADSEAVAVLNTVGKEFGITGDKAQTLADAATAYGNRRVEAVLEAGKKGYAEFNAAQAAKTKEYYGPEWKTRLTEATAGLEKLLPEGVTVDGLRKDPNFQALTNVWWFAEMGRKYHNLTSEQPSIIGEPERPKTQDLYDKYD